MFENQLLSLCVCCAAVTLTTPISLRAENPIPADCKTGGFFIGCQAYTFNRFSVFEAIEKTAEAGGKVIEFYPGQKLSKAEPNVKWDHNASAETIQKVKEKLAACLGSKKAGQPFRRNIGGDAGRIEAGAGYCNRLAVNIGGEYLHFAILFQRLQVLGEQNGDGVRLLAGGTTRRPYAYQAVC